MPTTPLIELWLCSKRVFPDLQLAVELCQTTGVKSPMAFTRQLLKELRRLGVKAEPIKAESCALLLAGTLWVQVVPSDADLAVQAAQLRTTMRQRAVARAGYIVRPGSPRPGWRWVQISARSLACGEAAEVSATAQELDRA